MRAGVSLTHTHTQIVCRNKLEELIRQSITKPLVLEDKDLLWYEPMAKLQDTTSYPSFAAKTRMACACWR